MSYTIGIDIGTSSIKAGLLNLETFELDAISSENLSDSPTLLAETLWEQVRKTIKQVLISSTKHNEVVAVGVAGQMHGAVFYNQSGNLINPIYTWKDQEKCNASILEKYARVISDQGYETGTKMACGYTGTILLWLKDNDPDLFHKVKHVGLISDFIRSRLIGANDYCTDPTNAFGTGLFDVRNCKWHNGLIAKVGLDIAVFPEVHSTSSIAGRLSREVSEELGLGDIPVIFGGGDNQLGMIGSGIVGPESPMLLNIGTAAQISKVIKEYTLLPGIDTRSFPGEYFALVGASLGGGGSYKWLRNEIEKELMKKVDFSQLDDLASQVPPGSDGLVFCTGPSRQDQNRKPGFYGNLSKTQSLGHKARAVMEGVLMDLFEHFTLLRDYDHNKNIIGGGKGLQNSNVWSSISANILGIPIRVVDSENVVRGAAILAGMGIGKVNNLGMLEKKIIYREISPNQEVVRIYKSGFAEFYKNQAR